MSPAFGKMSLREKLVHYFEARWYSPRAPWYLLPLAALFGIAASLRRALYARSILRSRRVAARVVVVGNVTVGGSGKTPLVAWLARRLVAEGAAVGIVTRGYGGENRVPHLLDADSTDAGDEARWLARETAVPVAVGRERAAAARLLADALNYSRADVLECETITLQVSISGFLSLLPWREKVRMRGSDAKRRSRRSPSPRPSPVKGEGEDRMRFPTKDEDLESRPIILADDGLQHYRLARHVEIVAVDGARGFGNGALLPAGPLREKPARIARADAVVVKGEGAPPLPAGVPVFRMRYELGDAVPLAGGASIPLADLRGRPVVAVAGIADPESFFRALEAAGLTLDRHPLPDHADRDLLAKTLAAIGGERPILMTDKDAAKLASAAANAFRVPLALALTETDAAGLMALVRGRPADHVKEEN